MRLVISILFLVWSSSLSSQFYLDLSPQECFDLIEEYEGNPKFTLLDVRTPAEYIPEHLEGAFNRDFYDIDFKEQLDSLDKTRIYLIYCRSGSRSGQTLDLTEELQFDTVFNMIGGITQWIADGYPVTDVIPDYEDIYAVSSSTQEADIKNYYVYPNPTTGVLNINFTIDSDITIYDTTGAIVSTSKEKNGTLDLSTVSRGMYLLKTEVDGQTIIQKIFKL